MNQVLRLSQLQKIDLSLDQISSRLREIAQIIASDKSIQQAEASLASAKEAFDSAKRNLLLAEDNATNQRIKIETNEATLYAGKIHNPKELQDLQKDIISLKKYLITLDDQLLEAMLASEASQDKFTQTEKALAIVISQFAQRQSGLLGERASLEQNRARLNAERSACLAQIDQASLVVYERLRSQKRGVALSLIEDGSCKSCGANLRPAELQEAHSPDKLVFCNYCGRIIYTG